MDVILVIKIVIYMRLIQSLQIILLVIIHTMYMLSDSECACICYPLKNGINFICFICISFHPILYTLHVLHTLQQSVIAQTTVQVQLLRFENPSLLEFRPNESTGPFCCCNMVKPCFASIQDFPSGVCTDQCGLRMTICVQNLASGEESCRVSATQSSSELVIFTADAPVFPEEQLQLLLSFSLNASSTSVSIRTMNVCKYNHQIYYNEELESSPLK